tara:strand:+ start:398 stop:832 length:435 start_codon:yes stop_codon:yes gene_type:complete
MILSKQLLLSDDQAVTVTALSTNVIDLGVAATPYRGVAPLNRDLGKGTPVPFLIQVTEDFVGLTSVTATLEVSDNEDMSASTVLNTELMLLADLVAGKQAYMQYLPNGVTQRYLAVRYTVAGTATAGKFTTGVTMGNQTNTTGA